jgi:pimeloyl-ACP methyl ester carboxylesterase
VSAKGPNWATETTFELLDWQDIVRDEIARPAVAQVAGGMIAFGDFLFSGTAKRYFEAAWPYGAFFLVPFLNVILYAAVAIGAGILAAGWAPENIAIMAVIGALVACGVFALLMRWPGGRWHVHQALADWIFARAFMYGRRPAMDARLEQFAQRFIAVAQAGGCDEILVVGHSLGATMALMMLTRALEREAGVARRGSKICLLTVGSTIPKLALHPAATRLRAGAARVAGEAPLAWTEYQARRDAISFFRFDPVTLKRFNGNEEGRKPHIREVGIKDMMMPESYLRHWLHTMRLHYQFVMANERRANYDYLMFVCGPADFATLSLAPGGAPDVFDADGALQSPANPKADTGT